MLRCGQWLRAGSELTIPSGIATLAMQTSDGNLVLYRLNESGQRIAVWASNTVGSPGAELILQNDGNLVVYDSAKQALWASGTENLNVEVAIICAGESATGEKTCSLRLCNASGEVVWSVGSPAGSTSLKLQRVTLSKVPSLLPISSTATVDSSTLDRKVLCGYQGWFGCQADGCSGQDYGWWHWSASGGAAPPSPGNSTFDLVPDVSEYPPNALHGCGYRHHSGDQMKLFSSAADGVVDLHFQWMQQYGIDGIMLQRFLVDIQPGPGKYQKNKVLRQVAASSVSFGRVWNITWDVTNAPETNWREWIKADWHDHVEPVISKCPQYLHHDSKPVVCIFGLGLRQKPSPPVAEILEMIGWLRERTFVIGSGPFYWRSGCNDALPGHDAVHAAFDAIMPWSVGRYSDCSEYQHLCRHVQQNDIELCKSRGQTYAPVSFPGFSFRNGDIAAVRSGSQKQARELNQIPRQGGSFFRSQIEGHLSLVAGRDILPRFCFVAMFDEVNEATAIFKAAAREAEHVDGLLHLGSDGVEMQSDHYLRMVGEFTQRLRRS